MRNEEVAELLQKTDWNQVLSDFRGEIEQTPPMYSAKKIDGQKLYELARKGIEIERRAARVTILELEPVENDKFRTPPSALRLRVRCSAGTYIRTLAEDVGRKLGTAAHLAELRRTRAGKFDLSQSLTLEDLEKLEDAASRLIPMEEAVSHLPKIELAEDRIAKTRNGLSTRIIDAKFKDGEAIQMLDDHERLIAIGFYDEAENIIRPRVVLV